MEEHRESYRGHNIAIEPGADEALATAAEADAEPQVYIDGEPVVVVRDSAGMYIASGFAYAPQGSLVELAKRIVDYREAGGEVDRGGQKESGQPDGS
jgi:hypothetical protein